MFESGVGRRMTKHERFVFVIGYGLFRAVLLRGVFFFW